MKILALFLLLAWPALAQLQSIGGPTPPNWNKYSLVAIANGVNGCAAADGCWQVNGVLGANKTAGLTQNITIFAIPARGFVSRLRIKTAVAFTGTATAIATLGTTASNVFYLTATYNLQTAVSDTNYAPSTGALANVGSDTAAGTNFVLGLTTTVQNITSIAAGSAVDIWVLWSTLP